MLGNLTRVGTVQNDIRKLTPMLSSLTHVAQCSGDHHLFLNDFGVFGEIPEDCRSRGNNPSSGTVLISSKLSSSSSHMFVTLVDSESMCKKEYVPLLSEHATPPPTTIDDASPPEKAQKDLMTKFVTGWGRDEGRDFLTHASLLFDTFPFDFP